MLGLSLSHLLGVVGEEEDASVVTVVIAHVGHLHQQVTQPVTQDDYLTL